MFKHKVKATLIHLALSILLVGLIMGSIIFFFFPSLFIGVSDFKEVASIIIIVDLVLGPLLTFVVFQPHKKTLKFDLSVIAAIQIVALSYGAYALYQIHPVYITFNIDRFSIINAVDAEPEKAKLSEYNISKLSTAKLAFVKLPDDIKARNQLIWESTQGGQDIDSREEYYESYEKNISNIIAKGLDTELILAKGETDNKIKSFITKQQKDINSFVFLPITNDKKDAIIAFLHF